MADQEHQTTGLMVSGGDHQRLAIGSGELDRELDEHVEGQDAIHDTVVVVTVGGGIDFFGLEHEKETLACNVSDSGEGELRDPQQVGGLRVGDDASRKKSEGRKLGQLE